MQCEYCGKQAYITRICPCCKEHYCLEHHDQKAHDCPSHKQPHEPDSKPDVTKPQSHTTKTLQKPITHSVFFEDIQKKFFTASFMLVVAEEILRLIGYMKNPLSLAYLDGNMYVEILYQSMTPQTASVIIFVLACCILFGTKKLASKNRSTSNPYANLLKRAIPLCIFAAITITYLFSITNWILILS